MTKKNLGIKGEKIALDFLKNKGMEILQTNFRYGHKEIDIIAKHNNVVVFIEVKTARSENFGTPEEKVDLRKQKQIIEVANFFIQNQPIGCEEFRFDVVAIDLKAKEKIRHIKNAFTA